MKLRIAPVSVPSRPEWNEREGERRIACVAILWEGETFSLPPPARHHDVIHAMSEMGLGPPTHREQGFLTDDGYWLRRAPARVVAEDAGQMIRSTGSGVELYSEDLW